MNIHACLIHLRPSAQFKINANDYNQLEMLDGTEKPALAELQAVEAQVNAAALKAKTAAKRYAVEVAGINFVYRTVPTPVSTSRDTRASMLGAYSSAKEGRWVTAPDTEADFKFGDGKFRPCTAQEVIDIYLAVEAHVKACYAVENKKIDEIDSTGTTDLNTGWPL